MVFAKGAVFPATKIRSFCNKIDSFCNYKEKKKENIVVGIMFVAEKSDVSCRKIFSLLANGLYLNRGALDGVPFSSIEH
jgi:hypothetical protein